VGRPQQLTIRTHWPKELKFSEAGGTVKQVTVPDSAAHALEGSRVSYPSRLLAHKENALEILPLLLKVQIQGQLLNFNRE
jgi:hypothetical protein